MITAAHRVGVLVSAWGVETPTDMARCRECGFDSITTARPHLLLDILGARAV